MTERVQFYTEKGGYWDVEVHFSPKYEHWLEFAVYPISKCWYADGREGFQYQNKHDSDTHDDFSPDNSRMLFEGSYCWRGVWDGRIHLPNGEEYDTSEFVDMARILKECVAPWCKKWIQIQQPDLEMDEKEYLIDDTKS